MAKVAVHKINGFRQFVRGTFIPVCSNMQTCTVKFRVVADAFPPTRLFCKNQQLTQHYFRSKAPQTPQAPYALVKSWVSVKKRQ